MKPPGFPPGQPDRSLELEALIEPLFEIMLTVAVSAGYTETEACHAIMSLADHRQLANTEKFLTEQIIVGEPGWVKK